MVINSPLRISNTLSKSLARKALKSLLPQDDQQVDPLTGSHSFQLDVAREDVGWGFTADFIYGFGVLTRDESLNQTEAFADVFSLVPQALGTVNQLSTSSTKPYGFFLDTLSSKDPNTGAITYYYNHTPVGSVIIGETDLAGQKKINDSQRFFGMSAALNGGADAAATWDIIAAANDKNNFSNDFKTKASEIVAAALQYPIELDPTLNGGRPEDPSNWFYAQNFQISNPADAAKNYALVTTALWAANQLYPNTKIIPVFDSYYVKGLNLMPTPDYNIVSEVNSLISTLGIPALNEFKAKPPTGKTWNMLSVLHNNGLIDGWIGDIYGNRGDTNNEEGILPEPESPFYGGNNPVPYVLQSRADYLDLKIKLPITSDFYDPMGIMPFNASIDFNGSLTVPSAYDPTKYLTPKTNPYPTASFPVFTTFTNADDLLLGQSNINYQLKGGNDTLEVIGGLYNYANGNKGRDTIILLGGKGKYRGGNGSDTFEVINSEEGTIISGNRGVDFITGSVTDVIYRAGKGNDVIEVSQGVVWGNRGKDVFRGVIGEGYAEIRDYTIGDDVVELPMPGSWCIVGDGMMFTDESGDKIMHLIGINNIEQVAMN